MRSRKSRQTLPLGGEDKSPHCLIGRRSGASVPRVRAIGRVAGVSVV
jgi:hypothetical protein